MAISNRREPFDRDFDFVVARTFKVAGQTAVVGRDFDKSLTSTRRLRQLYEIGLLKVKDYTPTVEAAEPPGQPPPPPDVPKRPKTKQPSSSSKRTRKRVLVEA